MYFLWFIYLLGDVKEYLEEDTGDEDMEMQSKETATSGTFRSLDPTFLSNFVSTAIGVLWPENTDLHIAQYLSKIAKYDALLVRIAGILLQ